MESACRSLLLYLVITVGSTLIVKAQCPTVLTPVSNQTITGNDSTQFIRLSTNGGSTLYSWTNSESSIGLPANGAGNIPVFMGINGGLTPVTATITVNSTATPFAYLPTSFGPIYVLNQVTRQLIDSIDVGNYTVEALVSPDGKKVFAINPGSNTISVINTSTQIVAATITTPDYPESAVLSPDGSKLYVGHLNGSVSIINTTTNTLAGTITTGGFPRSIVISPDGTRLYVANTNFMVQVVNTSTNLVIANLTVGSILSIPNEIAVSPDGSKVFVALGGIADNAVTVIQASTNTIVNTIPAGANPFGVAVSPDGTKLYVSNTDGNSVSVKNISTGATIATIPVGQFPKGISVSPDGLFVYVVNSWDGTVSIINTLTNTVGTTLNFYRDVNENLTGNYFTVPEPCNPTPIQFTFTVNPQPAAIHATPPTGWITVCAGTASVNPSLQQFSVSGDHFFGNVTVTSPSGFEVSTNAGSGFGTTVSLSPVGRTLSPSTVYVRSSATATPGEHFDFVTVSSQNAKTDSVKVHSLIFALPVAQAPADQTFITGLPTTPIPIPGTGNLYQWVNSNPVIGLAATGVGPIIPSFMASNGSRLDTISATITATPYLQPIAFVFDIGNSSSIDMINLADNSLFPSAQVINPNVVAVTSDSRRLYSAAAQLVGVDPFTKTEFARISLPGTARSMVMSPDNTRLYTATGGNNYLSVVNVATNSTVTNIPLSVEPYQIVISPDGSKIFMMSFSTNSIYVVDAQTFSVNYFAPANSIVSMAVSPDGKTLFGLNPSYYMIQAFDIATHQDLYHIPVNYGEHIAINPDGTTLYVTQPYISKLVAIDLSSRETIGIISSAGEGRPAVSKDGSRLFVPNTPTKTVMILDAHTLAGIATAPTSLYGRTVLLSDGLGCSGSPVSFKITIRPTPPKLDASPAEGIITACQGSTPTGLNTQQFTVTGSYLTSPVTVTAPSGFEVSKMQGSGYASQVSITPADSTVDSTRVYVRSAASAPSGTLQGNVEVKAFNAPTRYVPVNATVFVLPTMVSPASVTLLSNVPSAPVLFSATGVTPEFLWTNSNPAIGLPASGSGPIPAFTPINSGGAPIQATITVTPRSTPFIYTTNDNDTIARIINTITKQVISAISVPKYSLSATVSPDGTRAYFAATATNSISVVDTRINKVIKSIPTGISPVGLHTSADGKKLYVANAIGTLMVIDTDVNQVIATYQLGVFDHLLLNRSSTILYALGNDLNGRSKPQAFSTSTFQQIGFTLEEQPTAMCLSPDDSLLFVASMSGDPDWSNHPIISRYVSAEHTASPFLEKTKTMEFSPPSYWIGAMKVTPDGKYLIAGSLNYIYILRARDLTLVKSIPVSEDNRAIAISEDGSTAFVANQFGVNILDLHSLTLQTPIAVPPVSDFYYESPFMTRGTGCIGSPVPLTITVEAASTPLPYISATAATGSIFACPGSPSTQSQQIAVSTYNLTGPLKIIAPEGFRISTVSQGPFLDSLNLILSPSDAVTLFVHTSETAGPGVVFGQVKLMASGAVTQQVDVTAYIDLLPDLLPATLPDGQVNQNYSVTLPNPSQQYTFHSTTVPTGLTLDSLGHLQGIPLVGTDALPATIVTTVSDGHCQQTVPFTLTIGKQGVSVSIDPGPYYYDGNLQPATITTGIPNLPVSVLYNGSSTVPVNPGLYTVKATIISDTYAGTSTQDVQILRVVQFIFGDSVFMYNGQHESISYSTQPANVPVTITIDGVVGLPVNAGSYTVHFAVDPAAFYAGSRQVILAINKVPLIISAGNKVRAFQTPNPTLTMSFEGFVNGENSNAVQTLPTIETTATINSSAGDYPITLSGGFSANYVLTLQSGQLTITPFGQTIQFEAIAPHALNSGPIELNAVSSASLPVSFEVVSGPGLVSGSSLIPGDEGNIVVRAYNDGTSDYAPASAQQTILINPPDVTTGLSADDVDAIVAYPNPVNESLTIRIPANFGESTLGLYDMIGNRMMETKIAGSVKLNVKPYSSGVYFLRVTDQNGKDSLKRVVIL